MSEKQAAWRRLLSGWLEIAARFGEVQTLLVLALVYTMMFGSASLMIFALRKDLLHLRGLHVSGSAWSEADSASADLERARRLF
jgi:hypothetical protein